MDYLKDRAQLWSDSEPAVPGRLKDVVPLLERALHQFRHGTELGDGGIVGVQNALWTAIILLGLHVRMAKSELLEPLLELMNALRDVSLTGNVHPMLARKRVMNRRLLHADGLELKGRCLTASNLLHAQGMSRQSADRTILKQVRPYADRLEVEMTPKSLTTWRRDLRKKQGIQGNCEILNLASYVSFAEEAASVLEDAGYDAEEQVAFLLETLAYRARRT